MKNNHSYNFRTASSLEWVVETCRTSLVSKRCNANTRNKRRTSLEMLRFFSDFLNLVIFANYSTVLCFSVLRNAKSPPVKRKFKLSITGMPRLLLLLSWLYFHHGESRIFDLANTWLNLATHVGDVCIVEWHDRPVTLVVILS